MAQDGDGAGSDQPEYGGDGPSKQGERDGDDEQARVQLRGRGAEEAHVKILAVEPAYAPHAADDEDGDEEEHSVGE